MSKDKVYSPIEVCQVIGKALSKRIAEFESEIATLRARELRKAEAGICITCGNPDVPEYCSCLIKAEDVAPMGDGAMPGGMAMKELEPAKKINPGKSVVKSYCKGCRKMVSLDKHSCGVEKGETFIDKKNDSDGNNGGDQPGRLKDIGQPTPKIPKPKQVTPARHAEGGNDGSAVRSGGKMFPAKNGKSSDSDPVPEGTEKQILKESPGKPGGKSSGTGKSGKAAGGALMANKAEVPMAKPPSGGTGLTPKAPPMSGMKKAALPGTPKGDALQDAHMAPRPPAAPASKPINIPGRAQQFSDFMPAGKFTAAGAGLPGAAGPSKPVSIPGKGAAKPAAPAAPANAPFQAPPASVRPAAPAMGAPGAKPAAPAAPAPAAKPPAPAAAPAAAAPKPAGAAPAFGKSENWGNCALCGCVEHSGDCSAS